VLLIVAAIGYFGQINDDDDVFVTAPTCSNVPCRVSGASGKGFDVEFTPKESGL